MTEKSPDSESMRIHTSRPADGKIAVCLIVNRLNPGGAERQVLLLARRLPRDRFRVTIASLYDRGAWNDRARVAADSVVTMGRSSVSGLPASLRRLSRHLAEDRYEIVHPFAWPVNAFVPLMTPKGTSHIVGSVRAVDMKWRGVRRMVIPGLELRAWRICDHIISNSAAGKQFIVEKGIDQRRVSVIENGLDLNAHIPRRSRREVRDELGLPESSLLGLVIARLDPVKGIDRLIRAASSPDLNGRITFVVAGHGPERKPLTKLIRKTAAPVKLLGNRNDLPDLINAADFLCHPSLGESFPNAVAEAMAQRKPVVASAVGDTPRLVNTGITGVLFDYDARDALKEALVTMIENRDRFSAWGDAAFQRVASLCNPDRMIEEHVRVYESVIG